ncbi:SDR family oxidoreductase [Streptomyces sp. BRA346]|uniref:SDR family oxidoreductase n=1 Tax=Streptomyces sp. BRA346 TaxID=2878199 RepID=UPI004062C835
MGQFCTKPGLLFVPAGIHGLTRPGRRRVGQPTDVGDLAVYLAGDRSSFLTGETVVLDGGRTAKRPTPSA